MLRLKNFESIQVPQPKFGFLSLGLAINSDKMDDFRGVNWISNCNGIKF